MGDTGKPNVKQLLKEAKTCIISSSDIQQGVKIIKKILKCDANNFWAHIYYGIAAQKTEHHSEAIKIFERASNINPDAVESWKGIISCAKFLKPGSFDQKILNGAYSNMLRLEHDKDKWVELFSVVENQFMNDIISILSPCLDCDPASESFKHKTASRVISLKSLEDKLSGNTTLLAFKGYSKSLDFYDRPIFCQKAAMHFTDLKCYDELIDFMHYSFLFGDKIYKSKIFLAQTVIKVATHDIDKARKIIPFISSAIKEVSKNSVVMKDVDHQTIQIALGVIHYHEGNYLEARDSFESRSYKGNCYSTLMLLKILLKMMDYEGILFLTSKLGKTYFNRTTDEQLHFELISSLITALSCANDVYYLRLALKLAMKVIQIFGWRPSIIVSMCYACIGLKSRKVHYYLNKLQPFTTYGDDYEFICSLLKQKPSVFSSDSDLFALNQLHSAVLSILRGKIPKAVKTCMVAGERDSRLSDAYLVLGLYYEFNLDYTKSLICFDKARNNRPRDDVALRFLCDLLFKLDQRGMALNILESCRTGLFNKWHWTAEKTCLVAAEVRKVGSEFPKALSNLRHAQKLQPSSNHVLEKIAGTYAEMRMLGCAENYYLRILSSDMVDLKALLSLAHLRKLTLNYGEFYSNSIKCLNCIPAPNANSLDFRLSFALFLSYMSQFHLNMNNTSKDSFENSLKKLTVKVIKKLNSLKNYDWLSSVSEEKLLDYPVGLYFYAESHLFAAVKLAKRQEFSHASKIFQFVIMSTCRLLLVYSGSCPSFWKLLGDALIESSCIAESILVPEWIMKPEVTDVSSTVYISRTQRLHLAAKCYNLGLKLVSNENVERIHEFYFDMAVALAKLANLPETMCPAVRQNITRHSFEYACQSFVNYPSIDSETDVWIHFNLMGALGAMIGASEELFNSPFVNFSITVSEETRIMNQGTYYLKTGMYKEALKIYEQGRLLGDTNYAGPWVGQLLAAVICDEAQEEEMRKLIFQLKYHGNHPLLLWICTMVLFRCMHTNEFFEEEGMLRRVLKKGIKHEGKSPSRLTVLGYCLEKMGEVHLARQAYFMALRCAKYSAKPSHYDIFINNCIRVCGRCNLSLELIKCIDHSVVSSSSSAVFFSKHLTLNSFDHQTYVQFLSYVKHFIESSKSPFKYIHFIHAILLTSHMVPTLPTLLEYGQTTVSSLRNFKVLTKLSTKDLKSMFTSLPPDVQQSIFYMLENYLHIENIKSDIKPVTKLYIIENSTEEIGTLTELSGDEASPMISYNTKALPSSFESAVKKVDIPEVNSGIFTLKNHPYAPVFSYLKSTVFPSAIPYQEVFLRRRQKVAEIQEKLENDQLKSHRVASVSTLSSPTLKVNVDSNLQITSADNNKVYVESHGCHFTQKKIIVLMYQCLRKGLNTVAAKYLYLCLDIRCYKCLNIKKLIPIIAFLGVKMKNVKLLIKSSHMFPDELILRKSLLLLK